MFSTKKVPLNAAVLKLGVPTLFRVAKYFLRVAKFFLSHHFTLDSMKNSILPRVAEIYKYFEKGRDTKKFENPCLDVIYNGQTISDHIKQMITLTK